MLRNIVPAHVQKGAEIIRHILLKWSVEHPILSFALVVVAGGSLLPLVTSAALMPLAIFLTYTGILASQGIIFVIYNILMQGLLLAMIIVALFVVSFLVATSASVFLSYSNFPGSMNLKRKS